MPCPKCGGNDLWDDFMAWGCNRCKWFTTGGVQNKSAEWDVFNRGTDDEWRGAKAKEHRRSYD